ncbi:MAG: Uncharacterized MFS-type transporter, partial [uncultured Craurococcus sp.]
AADPRAGSADPGADPRPCLLECGAHPPRAHRRRAPARPGALAGRARRGHRRLRLRLCLRHGAGRRRPRPLRGAAHGARGARHRRLRRGARRARAECARHAARAGRARHRLRRDADGADDLRRPRRAGRALRALVRHHPHPRQFGDAALRQPARLAGRAAGLACGVPRHRRDGGTCLPRRRADRSPAAAAAPRAPLPAAGCGRGRGHGRLARSAPADGLRFRQPRGGARPARPLGRALADGGEGPFPRRGGACPLALCARAHHRPGDLRLGGAEDRPAGADARCQPLCGGRADPCPHRRARPAAWLGRGDLHPDRRRDLGAVRRLRAGPRRGAAGAGGAGALGAEHRLLRRGGGDAGGLRPRRRLGRDRRGAGKLRRGADPLHERLPHAPAPGL